MGEFGRTPRVNKDGGRDHWGHCSSVLFAGGGMRGGNLVGASDRICAFPAELPVGPADVVATIYHALGLEPHTLMVRPARPPDDDQRRPGDFAACFEQCHCGQSAASVARLSRRSSTIAALSGSHDS